MTLKVELNTFWKKSFTPMTATTAKDGTTVFRRHAGAKAKLLFSGTFGWLVGALHRGKSWTENMPFSEELVNPFLYFLLRYDDQVY